MINSLDKISNPRIIVWKSLKKYWYVTCVPVILGIFCVKIGWYQNNTNILNVGVVLLSLSIFDIIISILYFWQGADKNFMQSVAEILNLKYFEDDVVFDKDSAFFNMRNDFYKSTREESENVIFGKFMNYDIKIYQYKYCNDQTNSTYYSANLNSNFIVLELKISHLIPKIICFKKSFILPKKYKENRRNDFEDSLMKDYCFYPNTIQIDNNQKQIISEIIDFIKTKDKNIEIEFCEDRIIIFQEGRMLNKNKIKNFLEITENIINKLQ